MRILLVEDEENLQKMITAILKHLDSNMDIEQVASGDVALTRYLERSYDLVITDHAHFGVFGIELIDLILARNPLQPVILQTGNYGEHIDDFKQKHPDIPFLQKPYPARQLQEVVRTVLNQWYQRKSSGRAED
jgi:DNA-binding NtrC family response regulator